MPAVYRESHATAALAEPWGLGGNLVFLQAIKYLRSLPVIETAATQNDIKVFVVNVCWGRLPPPQTPPVVSLIVNRVRCIMFHQVLVVHVRL